MVIAIRNCSHLARKFEPQTKDRDVSVLSLTASLGCLGVDIGWNMSDPNRCFNLVAMLAPRTAHATGVNLALRKQNRFLEGGRMWTLNRDGTLVDVGRSVRHAGGANRKPR